MNTNKLSISSAALENIENLCLFLKIKIKTSTLKITKFSEY
jgi:hypothetical protein